MDRDLVRGVVDLYKICARKISPAVVGDLMALAIEARLVDNPVPGYYRFVGSVEDKEEIQRRAEGMLPPPPEISSDESPPKEERPVKRPRKAPKQ